ncbi:MAG: hypothetical protein L6N96_05335 [Candidatus Methylarchaceae archaeon HK02M2]|nr:hypothetical protein [Candidatus Methylarchaceae archaeon HK02M2]
MSFQIKEDKINNLLGRREILCTFSSVAGSLTRQDAIKIISEKLKIDIDKVYLLSLKTKMGTRDISGLFYIYDNPEDAKKQLTRHVFLRMLPKEEREKIIKERKKKGKKVSKGS